MASLSPLGWRLRVLLGAERVIGDLRSYYGIGSPAGAGAFTGRRFEQLGGGGERSGVADRVTAQDLVAVETLSVTVPIDRKLDLLEGGLGAELGDLLSEIPNDVDLVDVDRSVVADGSPADVAWRLLESRHGIGWVTAGKLLARKRPRLLPVYDTVVRCALGRPHSFWLSLHTALREEDRALHCRLLDLKRTAGLPEMISALRVCDVAVWMGHRAEEHACR